MRDSHLIVVLATLVSPGGLAACSSGRTETVATVDVTALKDAGAALTLVDGGPVDIGKHPPIPDVEGELGLNGEAGGGSAP